MLIFLPCPTIFDVARCVSTVEIVKQPSGQDLSNNLDGLDGPLLFRSPGTAALWLSWSTWIPHHAEQGGKSLLNCYRGEPEQYHLSLDPRAPYCPIGPSSSYIFIYNPVQAASRVSCRPWLVWQIASFSLSFQLSSSPVRNAQNRPEPPGTPNGKCLSAGFMPGDSLCLLKSPRYKHESRDASARSALFLLPELVSMA